MAPDDDKEDFAALLAEYEKTSPAQKKRDPQVGEIVRGRVVSIGQEAAFIDLGAKSEGMIDLVEVRDEEGKLRIAVGDLVEGRVVEVGGKAGCIVLGRSMGRGPEAKAALEQAYANRIPVEGVVSAVNKGGVEVQVAGVRGFCPISQLDVRHVEDATAFVGQKLSFRISRYEGGPRGNLVLSRRALLEEEAAVRAADTRGRLVPGAILTGKVSSLKDYGAFIDLGGIEGMLHISELGFSRVAHPKDVLTVGQDVDVQVLRVDKSDDPRRPEKVSLSLKSLERDPWKDAAARFTEGTRLSGTVARVEPFGAFVEVAPGVEGLIHVSELSGGRPASHARGLVKPGQTLQVTVLSLDLERRRLSLALAASDEDAGEAAAPAAPARLGTLADLLQSGKKQRSKDKKR